MKSRLIFLYLKTKQKNQDPSTGNIVEFKITKLFRFFHLIESKIAPHGPEWNTVQIASTYILDYLKGKLVRPQALMKYLISTPFPNISTLCLYLIQDTHIVPKQGNLNIPEKWGNMVLQ